MEFVALVRRFRLYALSLLSFDNWHESVDGRPIWARYDRWEFRPITPQSEPVAYWWMRPTGG